MAQEGGYQQLGEAAALAVAARIASGGIDAEAIEVSGPHYSVGASGDVTLYVVPWGEFEIWATHSTGSGFKTYWIQVAEHDTILGATFSSDATSTVGRAVNAIAKLVDPTLVARRKRAAAEFDLG